MVVLILVGGIGYGTAFAWRQYTDAKNNLSSEQAKNQELKKQNSSLQRQLADKSETPEVLQLSESLPDGKTISYPLTTDNSQVLFWNQDGVVQLSDKRAISFVASAGASMRKAVCGSKSDNFDQMDIGLGSLDTGKKEFVKSQTTSCLELLASPAKNTDKTIQPAAKAVLDKVNDTLAQFIQSATIQ